MHNLILESKLKQFTGCIQLHVRLCKRFSVCWDYQCRLTVVYPCEKNPSSLDRFDACRGLLIVSKRYSSTLLTSLSSSENAAPASNGESNTNLDEHKLARARKACRKITSQPPDCTSHSPQLHPQTVARIKAWNSALEAGHQAN